MIEVFALKNRMMMIAIILVVIASIVVVLATIVMVITIFAKNEVQKLRFFFKNSKTVNFSNFLTVSKIVLKVYLIF